MKIKTAEAAAVMGCSPQFVRVGMQQGKLNIGDGEYTNSLQLGKFAFIPRSNGNLSFKKIVD